MTGLMTTMVLSGMQQKMLNDMFNTCERELVCAYHFPRLDAQVGLGLDLRREVGNLLLELLDLGRGRGCLSYHVSNTAYDTLQNKRPLHSKSSEAQRTSKSIDLHNFSWAAASGAAHFSGGGRSLRAFFSATEAESERQRTNIEPMRSSPIVKNI